MSDGDLYYWMQDGKYIIDAEGNLIKCARCPCETSSSSSSSEVQLCPSRINVRLVTLNGSGSYDYCIQGEIGIFTLKLVDYSYDGYTVYATYRYKDSDGNYVAAVTYWDDEGFNPISNVTFSIPPDSGTCFIGRDVTDMCRYDEPYGAILIL